MHARVMRVASLLIGVGLLVWLVVSSDVRAIVADLARIGPRVLIIVLLECMAHAFNTLGWWFTLPPGQRAGTYAWLFWVRSAGQALNESTPLASLGGEPAKLVLLRSRVSTGAAAASLLATKVAFCSAEAIFIIVGMALVWSRLALPRNLSLALFLAFVATVGGVAVFAVVQLRGIGTGTAALLQWIRLPGRFVASLESPLRDVDAHLRDFYRARTGDLVRAIAAHGAAFACGVLQILLLLGWLGLPFDPVAAFGIDAFAALISLVTFIIPGSLGVQEGGKVLIFTALGLPRSAAMAVGITFRLIAFIDIAVGLAALTLLQQRSPTDRATRRASVR